MLTIPLYHLFQSNQPINSLASWLKIDCYLVKYNLISHFRDRSDLAKASRSIIIYIGSASSSILTLRDQHHYFHCMSLYLCTMNVASYD